MKKVLNVGIGGRSFVIDEDAYQRLEQYLQNFRRKIQIGTHINEVMDDLEMRIAELFAAELNSRQDVVNIDLVNRVIAQLGMPDGSQEETGTNYKQESYSYSNKTSRKYYRDSDNKVFGGVCSGLAAYLDIDVLLVRLIFVIAFLMGSLGFWVYVILWVVAPLATTPAQKCEMRGIPPTAENMNRFSNYYNNK